MRVTRSTGSIMPLLWTFLLTFAFQLQRTDASSNFRIFYVKCLNTQCKTAFNVKDGWIQPWSHKLLGWTCKEECSYQAMWLNEQHLKSTDGKAIKYKGKWPFISVFGVQEPASTLFSFLHFLASVYIFFKWILKRVPRRSPMFWVISSHCGVGMNAWVWSTAFHARDMKITERLDYYGANAFVLYSTFVLFARLLIHKPKWMTKLCLVIICLIFVWHVRKMEKRFNYEYNMKVMVVAACVNYIGWLLFCFKHRRKPHVKNCLLATVITMFFLLFELFDFPPVFYVFDAHSIWHGATLVVPFFLFRFLIDESIFLLSERHVSNKITTTNGTGFASILRFRSETVKLRKNIIAVV